MKIRSIKFPGFFILVYMGLSLCSCSDDSQEKSTEDIQKEKLVGTWSCMRVALDDTDESDSYKDFVLVISSSQQNSTLDYLDTGRPSRSAWDKDGTFEFGSVVESDLLRDDDVSIQYQVTENSLTLEFTYTGDGYDARSSHVGGVWRFEFSR